MEDNTHTTGEKSIDQSSVTDAQQVAKPIELETDQQVPKPIELVTNQPGGARPKTTLHTTSPQHKKRHISQVTETPNKQSSTKRHNPDNFTDSDSDHFLSDIFFFFLIFLFNNPISFIHGFLCC